MYQDLPTEAVLPALTTCAGASATCRSFTRPQYLSALQAAGFTSMSIDESHPVADWFDSVIVRARKPAG